MEPMLGGAPAGVYFYTSRIARAHPSPDTIAYFRSLYAGEAAVVVDLVGTGWSANRLIERTPGPPPDVFLVHHLDQPNIRNYYERHAAVSAPIAPLCCVHRSIIDRESEVLEELNRAPHPSVTDIVATRTGFQPTFMPDDGLAAAAATLQLHHAAFQSATALLPTLRAEQVTAMRRADHVAMITRIYRDMQGQLDHVAHFWQRKQHEEQIFQQFIEHRGAQCGAVTGVSDQLPAAAPAA